MKTTARTKALPSRHRLTDTFLLHLKPPSRTKMIWDIPASGFGVQITPNGIISFKVVYRHKRRLRWYTLDRYPAICLADARSLAQEVRAKAVLGGDPQAEKTASREGETLKAVSEKYVTRYSRRKNKSWEHSDKLMKRYVLPKLGTRLIEALTQRDIRRVFDGLTDKNGPAIANQVLAAVSAVLTWATEQQFAGNNVALGIRRNPTKEEERFLSDEELVLVWPKLDDLGYHKSAILRLILLTGQRPGEICAMRWEDIDLKACVWTLSGDPVGTWPGTKNKRTHDVPLSPEAMDTLDGLEPQASGLVFPNRRGKPSRIPATVKLWKGLGIPRFRPHNLRATAATGMDALGIHKEHIARVLNHVEGDQTAAYIRHDKMEQKRRALEAWGKTLMAVVERRTPESRVVQLRSGNQG